jgi:hypothetical protein
MHFRLTGLVPSINGSTIIVLPASFTVPLLLVLIVVVAGSATVISVLVVALISVSVAVL